MQLVSQRSFGFMQEPGIANPKADIIGFVILFSPIHSAHSSDYCLSDLPYA